MNRRIEPELLDQLPPTDRRAMQSRRDLQRLNAWMGHARIMSQALRSCWNTTTPERLVELGAGDATFLSLVAQDLALDWKRVGVVTVDIRDIVSPETRQDFLKLGWSLETIKDDVFDWMRQPSGEQWDLMIANLFLHHFTEEQLANLFSQAAQRTRVFVAIEPRRWAWSLLFTRLLWLIGCNQVTRHDAYLSVRAGFAGCELSQIWPANGGWSLQERPANFSSHLFIATRAGQEG